MGESHIFLQLFVDEGIGSKISKENIILINFVSINPNNIRRQNDLGELVFDLMDNVQCHTDYLFFEKEMLNFGKKIMCCTIIFGLELI